MKHIGIIFCLVLWAPVQLRQGIAQSQTGNDSVDEHSITINTDLVTLSVAVTDRTGRAIQELGQSAFTIFDNKTPQEIAFFNDTDGPASVGIIFDFSKSMSAELMMQARDAVGRFIETSHEDDEYFLLGFNERPQMLIEWTRDTKALLNKLTSIEPDGSTALYDAVYLGVEKASHGTRRKRALLVISDGQDNSSHYSLSKLKGFLKETDAVVYSLGVMSKWGRYSKAAKRGRTSLKEMAVVTGGAAFFPTTPVEITEVVERVAVELRHRSSIGYKPSTFLRDGKWHRLSVKVTPTLGQSRVLVRHKEGYYAVTNHLKHAKQSLWRIQ